MVSAVNNAGPLVPGLIVGRCSREPLVSEEGNIPVGVNGSSLLEGLHDGCPVGRHDLGLVGVSVAVKVLAGADEIGFAGRVWLPVKGVGACVHFIILGI